VLTDGTRSYKSVTGTPWTMARPSKPPQPVARSGSTIPTARGPAIAEIPGHGKCCSGPAARAALSTVRRWTDPEAGPARPRSSFEVEGLPDERVTESLDTLPSLRGWPQDQGPSTRSSGKRLIVIGGRGAESLKPCSGPVSEAGPPQHPRRKDQRRTQSRIVGEENLAARSAR